MPYFKEPLSRKTYVASSAPLVGSPETDPTIVDFLKNYWVYIVVVLIVLVLVIWFIMTRTREPYRPVY